MLAQVYSNALLEAAGNITRTERLSAPDATAKKVSRVCGSAVTVDLQMAQGVVTDFAIEPKACALGQASSALVARHIVGANADELRLVHAEMRRMLKEDGPPPTGARWADLAALEPIREYPARHASTLLVFEAVIACLEEIEAAEASHG